MIAAIVGAVAAASYLSGGFVWDDMTLIEQDLVLRDMGEMGALWTGPVRESGPGAAYFRPFALSIMAGLGRIGPWAIHLAALLVHAGSCYLLTRILRRTRWPLVGGLVFAVHPLASEVLAWCSAFPDALAVFMGLLSVLIWNRNVAVSLFVLLCGCLSKETAVLIPLVFGLSGSLSRRWWVYGSGVCCVVVLLRSWMGVNVASDWFDKLSLAPSAILWSVGSVAWPFPLSAVRDLWVVPAHMLFVGVLVIILMAWLARSEKTALIGLGLMVAGPVLALPVMLDGYLVAERYMYVGLVGVAMWSASLFRPPPKTRLIVLPVALCLFMHGVRSTDWRSSIQLFQQSVQVQPTSSYAWHFLGVSLAENGDMNEAAEAFRQAVVSGHPHPLDRFLCLKALVLAGKGEQAVQWLQGGPQENLTAESIAWRARAYFLVEDFEAALLLLEMLETPTGYDGPGWVQGLLAKVREDIETTRTFRP